jgi:Arc/MetJ-type ribon-helix-helix transcriptional regulator
MKRTQIYLSSAVNEAIKKIMALTGQNQSEVIREAVVFYAEAYAQKNSQAAIKKAAGMWKHRTDLPDFRAIRESLDR